MQSRNGKENMERIEELNGNNSNNIKKNDEKWRVRRCCGEKKIVQIKYNFKVLRRSKNEIGIKLYATKIHFKDNECHDDITEIVLRKKLQSDDDVKTRF